MRTIAALAPALLLYGCVTQSLSTHASEGAVPAFPGAEGYGKYTTGGRGGKVYTVSNLYDNGPGSLREAAEAKGPRIIVFAVAGTIHLQAPLQIKGECTIAGQSAPGDGICVADQPAGIVGNNVIMRYIRFRMGDKYQSQKGMVNGSGSDDAFGASRRKHIIIDHCSFSWSTDEVLSVYGGDSTTLQWNIIAEPLNYSYHFETGDTDFEHHGYGGIWGGEHLTAHHNLIAHCVSRCPRFNGTRLGASIEFADYRNNVVYNWQSNNVYGGEGGRYNVVANYYKPGPSTGKKVANRIVNPTRNETVGFGKFYVAENMVYGSAEASGNNALGVHIGNGKDAYGWDSIVMKTAFDAIPIQQEKADKAYESVLQVAGASFRRDTLDIRIVNDVRKGTGRIIDVQGGFAHGTPYQQTLGAWPALKSQPAPADTDSDGIPDAWEYMHGLNKQDKNDGSAYGLSKQYTNVEVYLNELAAAPGSKGR